EALDLQTAPADVVEGAEDGGEVGGLDDLGGRGAARRLGRLVLADLLALFPGLGRLALGGGEGARELPRVLGGELLAGDGLLLRQGIVVDAEPQGLELLEEALQLAVLVQLPHGRDGPPLPRRGV